MPATFNAQSPAIFSKTTMEVKITGSYYPIYGVTSIGAPSFTKTEIDVSHMNSDRAKEYKAAALYDPGTLTLALQYNPKNSVHAYMVSQSATPSGIDLWKITYADSSCWGFSGSLLSFVTKADNPSSGILTADVAVRITGPVDFAATAT